MLATDHALVAACAQDVGVALQPGGARDLADDAVELLVLVEAVVERERVERGAERARRGEHADRAGRRRAPGALLDQLPHGDRCRWAVGPTEQVAASYAHDARRGLHEPAAEQRGELRQVGVEEAQRMAELVGLRAEAAVADLTDVERAGGHAIARSGSAVRIAAATRWPLFTPSSWKPQLQ